MSLKLLTIPFSHYCEKARWALDRSGLDYLEEGHLPVWHYAYNRKYGAGPTVPVLVTEDQVLCDSADILNYVQQRGTELYPQEREREIRSWEERFDRIGILARAWAYSHIIGKPELMQKIIRFCEPREQQYAQPFFGVMGTLLSQKYGVRPGRGAKYERELNAHFDQLDWLLRDGRRFLVGEQFSAADLTLCALAGVLVHPEEYGYSYPELADYPESMRQQVEIWRERPVGQYILRTYREQRKAI